ncbi:MAG: pyridoxal-phosphate dependent enzyme [Desulfobacterales bacterium]|nr:MAG: pyridoxal-phosphate dependent enzyme [Desulfobacterales bacterium]
MPDQSVKREFTLLSNDRPFNLMDGATGEATEVVRHVDQQLKISNNPALPLAQRLEAYEDIVDSEVGDTSMVRARNIEREVGLRQIYLKFEGGNPTGTQKDRIAFAQAMDALRRGYDSISVATCGNYGVAVALAASLAGLRCRIHIPESYHTSRIKEMTDLGASIIRVAGDYEHAVIVSMQDARKNECYDANPGGDNTVLQLRTYGEIAHEIYDELRDAPWAVTAPVSNGTTLAGISRGFLSLYRRGKTSRMPRIVAGSSFRKNPIVHAFLKNRPSCEDLNPDQIHETSVNEPLINWHAIDGDHALEAIRRNSGWAVNASDKDLRIYSRLIREKEGLQVLPASTAGLIALMDQHHKEPLPNDRYVVVLTGRKS